MPDDKDITAEPINGLPEQLPAGEEILWQGRPGVWALAKSALAIHWVVAYFVILAVWRVLVSAADAPLISVLPQAVPFLLMGILAAIVLWGCAFAMARATVYTLPTA